MIALILTIPSDVSSLMDLSNFVAWSFVALVMVSLIVMRFTKKDVERAFKVSVELTCGFVGYFWLSATNEQYCGKI